MGINEKRQEKNYKSMQGSFLGMSLKTNKQKKVWKKPIQKSFSKENIERKKKEPKRKHYYKKLK